MNQLIFKGGETPIYGISKHISHVKDSRYSPNLWRFLTYKNKLSTNIFQDPKDGRFFIGLRNEKNIFCGAKLMDVFCNGNKAFLFSFPTSITEQWNDVTEWFWTTYLKEGKNIYNMPNFNEIKPITGK